MRGNECQAAGVSPQNFIAFTIPMRGNEGRLNAMPGRRTEFTIPMRGNELERARSGSISAQGGSRSP